MPDNQIVITVDLNAQGAVVGVNNVNAALSRIEKHTENISRSAASAMESNFGAHFFANIADRMVSSFRSGLSSIVTDAIASSSRMEAAFKGLESIGKNLGIDPTAVTAAVKNLDIVRNGLLSVSEAATSFKNLLAANFTLEQTTEIVKSFGDTAAFGRQAALSYGQAISSATEGIKNLNSITSDNAGVTKNLSQILRERGFELQDTQDKLKGVAAREALAIGLVKEARNQYGDAAKVLETYQGQLIQLDTAYQVFLARLGDTVTQSTIARDGLKLLVGVLQFLGNNIPVVLSLAAAFGVLTVAVIAMNTSAIISAIPALASVIASVRVLGQVVVGTASLVQGAAATMVARFAIIASIVVVVGTLIAALYKWLTAEREIVPVTKDAITATHNRIAATRDQIIELGRHNTASKLTGDALTAERAKTEALIAVKREQLALDEEAQRAQPLQIMYNVVTALDKQKKAYKELNDARFVGSAAPYDTSGQERRIAAMTKALNAVGEADADVRKTTESFLEFGRVNNLSTDALVKLGKSAGMSEVEITALRSAVDAQAAAEKLAAEAIDTTTNAYERQRDAIRGLKLEQENLTQNRAGFQALRDQFASAYGRERNQGLSEQEIFARNAQNISRLRTLADTVAAQEGRNPAEAKKIRQELLGFDPVMKSATDYERQVRTNTKALGDLEKVGGRTHKAAKTDYEQLADRVRKLRFEIQGLTDVTSKQSALKFAAEDLERQKRDLEKILDMRRDLGLPLDDALPRTAAGARAVTEQLERLVRVRDGVKQVTDEQRDAEEKLAIAYRTAYLPVVDASTRATIMYLDAVRERRNAEQELTAEVVKLSRLRQDAMSDELGETTKTYMTLRRDLLQEVERLHNDVLSNRMLQDIAAGKEIDIATAVSGRIEVKQVEPPKELVDINSNVAAILAKLGGASGTTGGGTSFGATAVSLAAGDVGLRESGGSNRGSDIKKYFDNLGVKQGYQWCAAFVSYFVEGAEKALKTETNFPKTLSTEAIGKWARSSGLLSAAGAMPNAGDVFLSYGNRKGRYAEQHTGFVESVDRERGLYTSVEGNTSNAVRRRTHRIGNPNERFVRIGGGVSDAGNGSNVRSIISSWLDSGKTAISNAITSAIDPDADAYSERTTGDTAAPRFTAGELRRQAAHDTADIAINQPRNERDFRMMVEQERQVLEATETSAEKQKQYALDVQDAREQANRRRRDDERATNINIEVLTKDLADAQTRTAEFVARVQGKARESHMNAQISTAERIQTLQYDIAHASEGASDRYEMAWLDAIRNVQLEDERAVTRQIEAQVKLADASVYHADRANAKVLEFLASQRSVTDVIADFKIGVVDSTYKLIDSGLDRITSKLGTIGTLIKDLLSGLIRLALNSVFQRLFGGGGATGGAGINLGGGGQGGSNIGGSLLGAFLNRSSGGGTFTTGGFAGGAGAGAYLGGSPFSIGGAGGSLFGAGGTLSGGGSNQFAGAGISSLLQRVTQTEAGSGLTSVYSTATNQFASPALVASLSRAPASAGMLGSMTPAVAAMLPMLGLQFGGMLGGQSRVGQGLGMAGGLLLGGAGAVGLLGGAGAGIFASGGALSSLGGVAGFLTNPFTIGAGVALLIGAIIIGRNRARREAEKQRDKAMVDSLASLDAILSAARSGKIDSTTAVAQAMAIREQYVAAAGQLKDSKTRRIALADVSRLDLKIAEIKRAAAISDTARTVDQRLIPTFNMGGRMGAGFISSYAYGGNVPDMSGYGRVSVGGFDGRDRYLGMFADDETIVSPRDRAALGGAEAFRRANVRGYETGSRAPVSPTYRPSRGRGGDGAPTKIVAVSVTDERYADDLVSQLSQRGENILAVKVRRQENRDGQLGKMILASFE